MAARGLVTDRYRGGMSDDRRENPVVLSRIYTKTGDDGTTSLGDGSRAAKTDLRLIAYADVDEANCTIGVALSMGLLRADIVDLLTRVQNEMFDVGADLCNPVTADASRSALRVTEDYVVALEQACDEHNATLPTLRSFVLPGGSPGAALLHVARTVARRAERSTWAALEAYPGTVNPIAARYLNRLSDLLFVLAREANLETGDVLWRPGSER
jgi:cob(I)alamin adenosyltransferase